MKKKKESGGAVEYINRQIAPEHNKLLKRADALTLQSISGTNRCRSLP